MPKVINALIFQAGWWACIVGVGNGYEVEAMVFCLIMSGAQLLMSESYLQDIKLVGVALLTGIISDSLLQNLSVIGFYGWALDSLSPFWLWLLWAMFALTLNSSLAFLKTQSPITIAWIGLIIGPLNYYAGAKLGAANLDATSIHIAALAIVWMVALPWLVIAAKHTPHSSKNAKSTITP